MVHLCPQRCQCTSQGPLRVTPYSPVTPSKVTVSMAAMHAEQDQDFRTHDRKQRRLHFAGWYIDGLEKGARTATLFSSTSVGGPWRALLSYTLG